MPTRSCSGRAADCLPELSPGEHALGLTLQLPDPLARDVQLVAELGEGGRVAVAEAVTPDQDVSMTLGELLDGLLQPRGLHFAHHLSRRVGGTLVLDEVAELRGPLVRAQRLVEAGRVRHRVLDVANLLDRPPELSGDLLVDRKS